MEKCRTNPPLIEKLLLRKAHDNHIPRQAHTSLPHPYPPYTIQISAETPMHLILPAGFPRKPSSRSTKNSTGFLQNLLYKQKGEEENERTAKRHNPHDLLSDADNSK